MLLNYGGERLVFNASTQGISRRHKKPSDEADHYSEEDQSSKRPIFSKDETQSNNIAVKWSSKAVDIATPEILL